MDHADEPDLAQSVTAAWSDLESAVRNRDEVMAGIAFRAWLVVASGVVDRTCDLMLDRHLRRSDRS